MYIIYNYTYTYITYTIDSNQLLYLCFRRKHLLTRSSISVICHFSSFGKNIIIEHFTECTWKKQERFEDVLYIWPAAERHWHIHQRIHARLVNAPGKIPFDNPQCDGPKLPSLLFSHYTPKTQTEEFGKSVEVEAQRKGIFRSSGTNLCFEFFYFPEMMAIFHFHDCSKKAKEQSIIQDGPLPVINGGI